MKNWMILAGALMALGLGLSTSAQAESFGGMPSMGGPSILPYPMPRPQPIMMPGPSVRVSVYLPPPRIQLNVANIMMPRPMYPQNCGGYMPCGGGYNYGGYGYGGGFYGGSHGGYGGYGAYGYGGGFYGGGYGGFYGGGYGYGFHRPMGCGHGRCRRFKRCCYRRGFKSFSLGIRVGGFGLALRNVSF